MFPVGATGASTEDDARGGGSAWAWGSVRAAMVAASLTRERCLEGTLSLNLPEVFDAIMRGIEQDAPDVAVPVAIASINLRADYQ